MSATDDLRRMPSFAFEDERPDYQNGKDPEALFLDLDGFEGPIDLLLALSRDQKVDLTKISILQLADQYLTFIEQARALRLEVAADYLVMAAWLAYLKSRMLLPTPASEDEPSAAELAARLAFQLQRLEAIRNVGARLMARPRLGHEFHPRGAPEPLEVLRHPVFAVTLFDLLTAYANQRQRLAAAHVEIRPSELYSMERALRRLESLVGNIPDWTTLANFLPAGIADPLIARSAIAATFVASLELVRSGRIALRQQEVFGPLYLRTRQREETLEPT